MTSPSSPLPLLASPSAAALAVTLILTSLVAGPAPGAEPDAAGAEVESAPTVPAWRAVAFMDRSSTGDCPALDARRGRCVEIVDFLDLDRYWVRPQRRPALPETPGARRQMRESQAAQRALLHNLADLHTDLWESVAFRWARPGDAIDLLLRQRGLLRLPMANELWDPAWLSPDQAVAVPDRAAWLLAPQWSAVEGDGTTVAPALYRKLRTWSPAGVGTVRSAVLMEGRFALRLGFSGRLHPYDVMDGDSQASAPFFEQVFPFQLGMESDDPRIRPLVHFAVPSYLAESRARGGDLVHEAERKAFHQVLLRGDAWQDFERLAIREFDGFSRAVGLQVLRFGLQDITENQMRVLAALTAMRSPPGNQGRSAQRSRDLVAAALGETDTTTEVEGRLSRSDANLGSGVRVRYEQLPDAVVDQWLAIRMREAPPGKLFFDRWNDACVGFLGDLLVGTERLASAEVGELREWTKRNLRPGVDAQLVLPDLRRLALKTLVTDRPDGLGVRELKAWEADRDRVETWILLDHANHAVASGFDPTPELRLPPMDISAGATGHWQAVLASHGYGTAPIPQGLGAVDPISVCTTRDGRDALEEPVFGAIHLDLLVAATAGQKEPSGVLWEVREQLPFLLVDDPTLAEPTLERVVDLPDGLSLYRVRFALWTGWHVLWAPERLADGMTFRLAARTAAICENMTLAPPELVPTIVRAGLLDGEFRPTVPVDPRSTEASTKQAAQRPTEAQSNEEGLAAATGAADQAAKAASDAKARAEKLAKDGPAAALEMAGEGIGALSAIGGPGAVVRTPVSASVESIRALVQQPLLGLAKAEEGLLIAVYDQSAIPRGAPIREGRRFRQGWQAAPGDVRPRTPYERRARPAARKWLHGGGWAYWLPHGKQEPGLIAPAFAPGDSVATGSPTPRWRRVQVADGYLTFGGGLMPLRVVSAGCNKVPAAPGIVAPCSSLGPLQTWSEGFGFDMSALLAIWELNRPRAAIEFGPEVRLDIGHGGAAWFGDAPARFETGWTLRPQVGVLFGGRFLPRPARLVSGVRGDFPWGAERPDGRARQDRVEVGLRTGLLLGPAWNGVEATVLGEFWLGASLRRAQGPQASITAYQPGALFGPYVRAQVGFPGAQDDGSRYLRLKASLTVLAGVRMHLRLPSPALLAPPEVK